MALWLFKEEPTSYSFTDLQRDGSAVWDGVTNALAQKHLRAVKPGDRVLYYHTGDEKAIVGIAEVIAGPSPAAEDASGKLVVVTIKPVRKLKSPVTLASIKGDPAFAGWELVRMARLSVMPVPEPLWVRIESLAAREV